MSILRPEHFHSSNQIPKQARSSSTGERPQAIPQGRSGQVAVTDQKSYSASSGCATAWWGEATWKFMQHTSLDSFQKLSWHISSLRGELLGDRITGCLLYLPKSSELSRLLCNCIVWLTFPGLFFFSLWILTAHKTAHHLKDKHWWENKSEYQWSWLSCILISKSNFIAQQICPSLLLQLDFQLQWTLSAEKKCVNSSANAESQWTPYN